MTSQLCGCEKDEWGLTYATFSIPIPCKPLHSMVISDQSRWILKLIRRLSLSSSLVTLDSVFVSLVFEASSWDATEDLPTRFIQSLHTRQLMFWWRGMWIRPHLSQTLRSILVPCTISLISWSLNVFPALGESRSCASATDLVSYAYWILFPFLLSKFNETS